MTWLFRLFRRKQMEEQLDKELRFHLDQHAADLIARGDRPDRGQATSQARTRRPRAGEGRMPRCPWHALAGGSVAGLPLRAPRSTAASLALRPSRYPRSPSASAQPPSCSPSSTAFCSSHYLIRNRNGWSRYMDTPKNMAISGAFHTPTFSTVSARVALSRLWRHGPTAEVPLSEPGTAEYVDGRQISSELFSVFGVNLLRGPSVPIPKKTGLEASRRHH